MFCRILCKGQKNTGVEKYGSKKYGRRYNRYNSYDLKIVEKSTLFAVFYPLHMRDYVLYFKYEKSFGM